MNPKDPAFSTNFRCDELTQDKEWPNSIGLTKLEYLAAHAMQGILTNDNLLKFLDKESGKGGKEAKDGVAVFAYQCAAALIERLNKETQ